MSISKPIHGQKSAQIKPHPGIVTRRTYRTLVCHGKVTKMFHEKKRARMDFDAQRPIRFRQVSTP